MRSFAQSNEFRAYWVDATNPGFKSSAEVTALISALRAGHFNAVIVQVRKSGTSYYNSHFGPKVSDISSAYDPLQDLISKAHDTSAGQRIEVHASIDALTAWNNQTNMPTQANHPYLLHKDWLTIDDGNTTWNGNAFVFDPGVPAVQQYVYDSVMDVVTNYSVDGINLDNLQYAGMTWGYNSNAVARFNALYAATDVPDVSDSRWGQFRRDQLTSIVRKIYVATVSAKPLIKVSANTVAWAPGVVADAQWTNSAPYSIAFQDWNSWMQEGILDFNVPQVLFNQVTDANDWNNWTTFAKDHRFNRQVVIGVGNSMNTAANAIVQMRSTRTATSNTNVADGMVCSSYAAPSSDAGVSTFGGALTTASSFDSVTPPIFQQTVSTPAMSWKLAPTNGIVKGMTYLVRIGNPIEGVTVTFTGPVTRTVTSDGTAFYAAIELPPGDYSVSASASGVGTASGNVTVVAGATSPLDLLLSSGDTAAPVIAGVTATRITDHTALITWTTDEKSTTAVDFGTNTSYGKTITSPFLVAQHSILLTNLLAGTTNHFRVHSRDASRNESYSDDFLLVTYPTITVPDIIIDNTAAFFAGSWTTGTSSKDKFGINYRFASAMQQSGSGTNLTFSNIAFGGYSAHFSVPGLYEVDEWHPAGSNRTMDAPFQIYANGSNLLDIVIVDETVDGGQWNELGVYDFLTDNPANTGGVTIGNDFTTGSVVIADAIRFRYVPSPPDAPESLETTQISSSQVTVQWQDTSTNEFGFTIYRSDDFGFSWNEVGYVPANVTSFTDTGLVGDSFYIYEVASEGQGGSSYSDDLEVETFDGPPVIVSQPTSQSGIEGSVVTLSVEAGGTFAETLHYQWQYNHVDISGETNDFLDISDFSFGKQGGYSVIVTNDYGSVSSDVAAVRINFLLNLFSVPSDEGGVSASPALGGYNPLDLVTLEAVPNSNFVFLGWGGDLYGATNPVTITMDRSKNITAFFAPTVQDLIVDNPNALYNGVWTLTLAPSGEYGDYFQYARTVKTNATASAVYIPSIDIGDIYNVYIWYPQPAANTTTNADVLISCTDGSSRVRVDETKNYGGWRLIGSRLFFDVGTNGYVQISNDVGDTNSIVEADAVRFRRMTLPSIVDIEYSSNVVNGSPALFNVVASGTQPLSYQWLFNGAAIPGATNNFLTISPAHLNNTGSYSLTVSNDDGAINTGSLPLQVTSSNPMKNTIAKGNDGEFQFTFGGDNGNYVIEISTNLINWTTVTNFSLNNSSFTFTDNPTNKVQFYRSRIAP